MARSTIQDVAKLAGVSEATVSRALRGLTNVAPATRERVEAAAAELRFTLSKSASSLASGKTHRILLLVSGGLNNWYPLPRRVRHRPLVRHQPCRTLPTHRDAAQ